MRAKHIFLIFLAVVCLGFKGNEIVELEGYFNARYSANFLKSTKNVKFVMPPGTRGRIEETKKFNSGNYGLKVELTSGPHKGESVWVYYNSAKPTMKLYPAEEEVQAEASTERVELATQVKTTQETPALRVPASEVAERVAENLSQANRTVRDHGKVGGPCADCEISSLYSRDVVTPLNAPENLLSWSAKASQDSPVMEPPTRTVNPYGLRPVRCASKTGGYDVCSYGDDPTPGKFKFFNRGPNKIVSSGESRMREWSFEFEAGARQSLGFSISDMPNATISQTQESYFILLPRKTLPHIRVEGNKQIVTLPTGETVTFNAQTKEVIGGVLSENGAITSGGKALNPANVSYNGNGVMVRVDRVGEEPRLQRGGTATISKQGRSCKVPTAELWPDQSKSSAARFKYFSDSDFDAYIKRRCGFGL
ncbi:MAG: hypothetical protein OM95_10610 [Bdellovibrio sp. ArHS]|uniref:hypothetical protein n=1 Tax=Bdellovibrio sp. ArHS TaxID=1569284 RepID=UPI000582962E|nr:hypothetical protein [Bdellovibrio sp. ArHS]KHD88205.1 MAG: hypothetical protein OM95_10610 [Bdellovibrio sp. ArHS]